MKKAAQMIVNTSARIRPGENVCIVADTSTYPIAKVLAEACYEVGAETVLTIMTPRAMHGNELPPVVASAMMGADVILAPTKYAITHTIARKAATQRGARTVIMRGVTEDAMSHGAILADYNEVRATSIRLRDILSRGKMIRLTTDLGTDATFYIEGRNAMIFAGFATEPHEITPLPAGEAAISPLEGKTQGRIIFDHSMDGIGLLSEPIRLTVKDGKAISIEGKREAEDLKKLLSVDDNALQIAEFAIGTNPKSRMTGNMLEDKMLKGCVHIAVGDNHSIGGTIHSNVHLDGVVLKPSVEVDGRLIVKNGELQV
jgi:leucyl aminopeptidase (aminopeptidase T)